MEPSPVERFAFADLSRAAGEVKTHGQAPDALLGLPGSARDGSRANSEGRN
jgi:hypothetical protein